MGSNRTGAMQQPLVLESNVPSIIGLIAGEGNFPVLLVQGAMASGVQVVVFGVNGLASDKLASMVDHHYTLKLTELTRLFELCRMHGVRHLIMAGRVPHKVLLRQISLDPRVLKLLGNLRNKKADSLLRAATQEIEKEGIEVLDSTLFLKWCMPKPGLLTPQVPLGEDVLKDIEFAYPIAKEVARLDIGQTIAVKNQIVVAVEGVEGTDALIRRAGDLAGKGLVFVKVSKPRQDMRFDVPVVGINTINNLVQIKAAALCMTAGQTIFLDREQAVETATRHKITLFAWQETGNETPYDDDMTR